MKSKVKRPAAELTRVEFAESKGWAPSYVTKLLKQERLVLTKDRKKINVAASERRLKETERVDKQGVREHHARKRKRVAVPASSAPAGAPVPIPETPGAGAEANGSADLETYNASRARRETAMAAMAEMDQRQRAGELVEVAQVRDAGQRIAAIIGRGFDQIGPRIGAVWAGENDPAKREQLFDEELRRIRGEWADSLAALYAADAEVKGG